MKARDLFAGTGWGVACQRLGIAEDGWEIMPEARGTRAAHGMHTAGRDVRDVIGHEGDYDLEIASPSCKTYSAAGNGAGRRALVAVLEGVRRLGQKEPMTWAESVALVGDADAALTLEPLRVALDSSARFLAWEQTPAVLPVWDACADVLRAHGWNAETAILNAEQYGVPQTRRRAVLLARRDGKSLRFPTITHSRFHVREPKRLDAGVKPWVSMAEALGWAGGEIEAVSNYGTGGDPRNRGVRHDCEPFAAITSKADRVKLRASAMTNAAERELSEPAPTITGGHDYNNRMWSSLRGSSHENATVRADDQPAPTLLSMRNYGGRVWQDGEALSIDQAAILQTYPPGFAFEGSKGKQFEQVGNAVPPLLAEAILSTFL